MLDVGKIIKHMWLRVAHTLVAYLPDSRYVRIVPRVVVDDYRPIGHRRDLVPVIPPRHNLRVLNETQTVTGLFSTRNELRTWFTEQCSQNKGVHLKYKKKIKII